VLPSQLLYVSEVVQATARTQEIVFSCIRHVIVRRCGQLPAGSHFEVTGITRSIGHTSIMFEATFPSELKPMSHFNDTPSNIVDFAMKNLLDDDNGMSPAE
jgi:hypothetical protein